MKKLVNFEEFEKQKKCSFYMAQDHSLCHDTHLRYQDNAGKFCKI